VRHGQDDPPGEQATEAEQRLAAVCGLDDPVRRRLYEYVSSRGEPVGRDQAAAATGIGRPLAAYHLDRLVRLGLLTAGYQRMSGRQGPGAGRPAKVYARSQTEFAVTLPPREYELAARLLVEAVEADPTGSARARLRLAARQHGAELGRTAQAAKAAQVGQVGQVAKVGQSAEAERADIAAQGEALGRGRVGEVMRAALAAHGFEPVADDDGCLSLRNCPFHRLAVRHRDVVCAMNLALLEGIVAGIGAGQELRPDLDPAPRRCCVVVRAAGGVGSNPPGAS